MTRLTVLKLAALALLLGVLAATGFSPAQARISPPRASQAYPPPEPVANDDFAKAEEVTNPYQEFVAVGLATAQAQEPTPTCSSAPVTASAWYTFTPTSTGRVSVGAPPPHSTIVTAVYTGHSLSTLTQVICQKAPTLATFEAVAGTTYHIQVSVSELFYGGGVFVVQPPPPPTGSIFHISPWPTRFDTVQFYSSAFDPAGIGLASVIWNYGDGTPSTSVTTHQYAADGNYTVTLTLTTLDGRTATYQKIVPVRTRDVAITRFSTPNTANAGQTRTISVDVVARVSDTPTERVRVVLYKAIPGYTYYEQIGAMDLDVPLGNENNPVSFDFSYTFSAADADYGQVSFRAIATMLAGRDYVQGDNTVVATTRVSR